MFLQIHSAVLPLRVDIFTFSARMLLQVCNIINHMLPGTALQLFTRRVIAAGQCTNYRVVVG
jgi:hypothetical protein